jgi:hypothetical protein
VGATIEEVDAQKNARITLNGFDSTTLNVTATDVLVAQSLISLQLC